MLDSKSSETAPERKAEVLRAVASKRLSLRAAQRVFSVSRGTIALWLQKTEAVPPLSETLLPAQSGDVLELNEFWSFVGSKTNTHWVWIALSLRLPG